jgi:hypothetical protein
MANQTYFSMFNTINYGNSTSNTVVLDITERVVTLQNIEKTPYVFYPLDITNGARADQIANYNFSDPFSSWVLYLTNNITDPYYDWYLDDDQFNQFIVDKYGSIQIAKQTIEFWRNNWVDQPSLSVSGYYSEIANNAGRVKYWEPANYDNRNNIIQYSRIPADWTVDTNQLISYQLTTNTQFQNNEPLSIGSNGTAQVSLSNGNTLVVKHVFFPNTTANTIITGQESGQTAAISSVNYHVNNIPPNEFVYWTPVYSYDMEKEKNEGNRTILVMEPNYVPSYIKNVKSLLSQK